MPKKTIFKKMIFSVGTVSLATAPIIVAVSCGGQKNSIPSIEGQQHKTPVVVKHYPFHIDENLHILFFDFPDGVHMDNNHLTYLSNIDADHIRGMIKDIESSSAKKVDFGQEYEDLGVSFYIPREEALGALYTELFHKEGKTLEITYDLQKNPTILESAKRFFQAYEGEAKVTIIYADGKQATVQSTLVTSDLQSLQKSQTITTDDETTIDLTDIKPVPPNDEEAAKVDFNIQGITFYSAESNRLLTEYETKKAHGESVSWNHHINAQVLSAKNINPIINGSTYTFHCPAFEAGGRIVVKYISKLKLAQPIKTYYQNRIEEAFSESSKHWSSSAIGASQLHPIDIMDEATRISIGHKLREHLVPTQYPWYGFC